MLGKTIDIKSLLPHREPMLLVSEIVACDDRLASTKSVVTAHWPLVDRDGANPLILIELVAQTAAVNNSWELKKREGAAADTRGWIVGVKSAKFNCHVLPIGTTVVVDTLNQLEYDSFRIIHGIVSIDGDVAAEVTLQLLQAQSETPVQGDGLK